MSGSMDLRDLVQYVSRVTDYEEKAVREIIDATFAGMEHGLATRGRVSIRVFGILEVEYRPGGPRKTGLPRFADTNGVVHVEPKHVPVFRPSRQLKARVQEAMGGTPELEVGDA